MYKDTIYTARREGREEGRVDIARNLLQMGISLDKIAIVTKLTTDEIRMLTQ